MEVVRIVTGEYYVMDFDVKGRPSFAGGPDPQEVLETFRSIDEDEDILESYFCNYPQQVSGEATV